MYKDILNAAYNIFVYVSAGLFCLIALAIVNGIAYAIVKGDK